jgi:hypothetical protein
VTPINRKKVLSMKAQRVDATEIAKQLARGYKILKESGERGSL